MYTHKLLYYEWTNVCESGTSKTIPCSWCATVFAIKWGGFAMRRIEYQIPLFKSDLHRIDAIKFQIYAPLDSSHVSWQRGESCEWEKREWAINSVHCLPFVMIFFFSWVTVRWRHRSKVHWFDSLISSVITHQHPIEHPAELENYVVGHKLKLIESHLDSDISCRILYVPIWFGAQYHRI